MTIACHNVAPAAELDSYRPSEAILAGHWGPPMVNRHCLTEAFQHVAREAGLTLLINGTYGEFTATAPLDALRARPGLRRIAGQILRGLRRAPTCSSDPVSRVFHVRLAPHRMKALPEMVRGAIAAEPASSALPRLRWRRGEPIGYLPGLYKALQHANEFYPGAIRMDFPYRDLRLLRLFATFPADMLREHSDRGLARKMLTGRLHDTIRLRRTGMPASPDHLARLQRQAPGARARIAAFRRAEVDDWLDLDWLDAALANVAVRGVSAAADANLVQLTAITAEFLTWWRTRFWSCTRGAFTPARYRRRCRRAPSRSRVDRCDDRHETERE